jgi:cell wall-associated NlpC family hydrolase
MQILMLLNRGLLPRGLQLKTVSMLLLSLMTGCVATPPTPENQQSGPASAPMPETTPPSSVPSPLPPVAPLGIDAPPATMRYGDELALRAIALVGKPYRYGGADLKGFDCSGLVYFIHQAVGIEVPRTAADQQRAATSVDRDALQPGDLLFFRTTRAKHTSHVGVYVGENRFVHAPQSGKLIELRTLDDQYYGKRLVGTGRLYPNS